MIYRFLKKKKYTHLGLAQRFHFLPDSPEAEITNLKQVENLFFFLSVQNRKALFDFYFVIQLVLWFVNPFHKPFQISADPELKSIAMATKRLIANEDGGLKDEKQLTCGR